MASAVVMKTVDNALCWAMVEMGRLGTNCLFRKHLTIDHLSLLKELEKEVDKLERPHSGPGFLSPLGFGIHMIQPMQIILDKIM